MINSNVFGVSSFVPVMPSGAINSNVYGVSSFVPVMPSSGIFSPSGVLTPVQILDFQNALVQLGHLPASGVTGRAPVASAAVIRVFQDNYNREQAHRGYRFSPRQIGVDGDWGANTQAALTNYLPYARGRAQAQATTIVNQGETMTPIGGPTVPQPGTVQRKQPTAADIAYGAGKEGMGLSIPQVPMGLSIPQNAFEGQTPAPTPSTSRTQRQTSTLPGAGAGAASLPGAGAGAGAGAGDSTSEIPWLPIGIVAVGVLAIGGALYVRSQRKGGRR